MSFTTDNSVPDPQPLHAPTFATLATFVVKLPPPSCVFICVPSAFICGPTHPDPTLRASILLCLPSSCENAFRLCSPERTPINRREKTNVRDPQIPSNYGSATRRPTASGRARRHLLRRKPPEIAFNHRFDALYPPFRAKKRVSVIGGRTPEIALNFNSSSLLHAFT